MKKLLFLALAAIVFFGALPGCNRRNAKRYKRLRETYNDTFRVALMRIDPKVSSVNREQALVIDDFLYQEALKVERFRVTDGDTVTAFLNKKGYGNDLAKLPPETIFLTGDSLDIEAFIVPSTAVKDNDVTTKLSLLNGYTGRLLWQDTDTFPTEGQEGVVLTNAHSESLNKLLHNLTEELSSIAQSQQDGDTDTNKASEPATDDTSGIITLNTLENLVPPTTTTKPAQTQAISENTDDGQPLQISELPQATEISDTAETTEIAETPYITEIPQLYDYSTDVQENDSNSAPLLYSYKARKQLPDNNESDPLPYNYKAQEPLPYDDNGLPLFTDYSLLKTIPADNKITRSMLTPVPPDYDSGIEQMDILVPDFTLRTPITIQAPIRSAALTYQPTNENTSTPIHPVHVTIFDLNSPERAKSFINDLFPGATPMLLHGITTYAVRDRKSEDVSTGITIGKFAIVSKAKLNSEQDCGRLTELFIKENTDVTEFYRNNPYRETTNCKFVPGITQECCKSSFCGSSCAESAGHTIATPPVTKIIREIKYKLQRVEIPTPVVPEITIYIDGKTILNLVKDNKLSTSNGIVLRTDGSQAGTYTDSDNMQTKAASQGSNNAENALATPYSRNDNTVKSIADVLKASTKTSDNLNEKNSNPIKTTEDPANSDEQSAPKGMTTENPGARLRYDLGCRYLATSRFDTAEKEFRLAFKMDPTFVAPLHKLHEIETITGKSIDIPSAEPEKPSVVNIVDLQTGDSTIQGATSGTTTTNVDVHTNNTEGTKDSPPVKNTSTSESNRSGTNDSILFTGLIIAVILVVIKLVFIDDVKN